MTENYYGGYSWESGCDHNHVTNLFKIGLATIYGGNKYQAEAFYDWSLMVSLLGHTFTPLAAPVKANKATMERFPGLKSLMEFTPPPLMTVDWPDGGVPVLDEKWWINFHKALGEIEGDVVLFCQGGHGRTGTALSILAGLSGFKKGGCPVKWVRKNYCSKAVETKAQIAYIEEVLGIKVKSLASNDLRKPVEVNSPPKVPGAEGTTPTGAMSVGGQEWVRDPQTGLLVRKSELEQDWMGSHWNNM